MIRRSIENAVARLFGNLNIKVRLGVAQSSDPDVVLAALSTAAARCPGALNDPAPDVTFDDPDDDERKIFIYLDGLSGHIHGNPETRYKDVQIRQELTAAGHDVLVITAHDLHDLNAMTRYFKRLARMLEGRDAVRRVADDADTWYAD